MSYHYVIKKARKKQGLLLREVSDSLSISTSTLYRYEEGYIRKIPSERLLMLLRFYRVSISIPPWHVEQTHQRLSIYSESRHIFDTDSLLAAFQRLDQRGKRTICRALTFEDLRFHRETPASCRSDT